MGKNVTLKKADKTAFPIKSKRGRPPLTGLYIDLELVDGRTRLGKTITVLRNTLREYVGVSTPATELLIQRIVFKSIRLSMYECAALNDGPGMKPADHYIPLSNSLRLDLQALAQMAGKPKAPDLNDYLKSAYGDKK
jgi:hypothetical protein